jgi:uncharacterized RDD family membrane protein YckC
MQWKDELRIETPEQIELDLELAGLGSRFLAQALDWLLKGLLTAVLVMIALVVLAMVGQRGVIEHPSRVILAAVVAMVYTLWLGYGIFFEVRWNGQTPGKRSAEVRVLREGGAPVDFRTACVRNLLAVADFLPGFFLLGSLLILLNARRQRLGDMAAGTIVVRERVASAAPDTAQELLEYAAEDIRFMPSQLSALTPADVTIVRSFLQRYRSLDGKSRDRLGVTLADRLVQKMAYRLPFGIEDGSTAREFLSSLQRDFEEYRRHL